MSASPKIRLDIADGCPQSVINYADVVNTYGGPPLIPADPEGGLFCRYHPEGGVPSPNGGQIERQTRLSPAAAHELARAIRGLDLSPPRGTFHCPADIGTVALIGLTYLSGPNVSLWYHASGCQTLDNGTFGAFEGVNSSFFAGFEKVINNLMPPVPDI